MYLQVPRSIAISYLQTHKVKACTSVVQIIVSILSNISCNNNTINYYRVVILLITGMCMWCNSLQAYQNKIHYPRYLILTYAWYTPKWWIGSAEEQEALLKEFEGCTAEERERVAQFIPAVVISEFISDNHTVADSKIVSYTCIILLTSVTEQKYFVGENFCQS